MKFIKIDRDILASMQEILSQSAGYEVGIEDELEYFNPASAVSWFVAKDSVDKNVGLIRQINQGEWSQGELYIAPDVQERKGVAQGLIAEFQKHVSFEKGHRLRFDVKRTDMELNDVLLASGFSQKQQLFLHFEFPLPSHSEILTLNIKNQSLNPIEVAGVLEHLHPVSESEVTRWIQNGTIRATFLESKITAAAQIFESDDATEINRIATHPLFLRRGHARNLVEEIILEAKMKHKERIYLKVESKKIPAILFYKNTGFIERPEQAQLWHTCWV